MQNKFAARCSCGTRVDKGCGLLVRVDDCWAVRCPGCKGDDVVRRKPVRRKTGRTAASKRSTARKPSGGARRPIAVGAHWTQPSPAAKAAATADRTHSRTVVLADGRRVACSEAYARTALECERAAAEGMGIIDLDLIVLMAELGFMGHVGTQHLP